MSSEVSFERDIVPLFKLYRAGMLWRMDLVKYDDVKRFARPILAQIRKQDMPPPPYPPLTSEEVARFESWMQQGYPE